MPGLKSEIAQTARFASLEEQAFLNLMCTSDCLHRAFQRRIRGSGLTATQYNVLMIRLMELARRSCVDTRAAD